MGAELAHFVNNSQALRAQARGGPIPHEGVKEGALLYMGAELAHFVTKPQALRAQAKTSYTSQERKGLCYIWAQRWQHFVTHHRP